MSLDRIDQMGEALSVLFAKEYRKISDILVQESSLRGKLNRLEEQIKQNQFAGGIDHMIQSAETQLLWQGWTTRFHRQLNTELAQVMATKLAAMDRIRTAFGRQHAISLIKIAERNKLKNLRIKQMEVNLLRCATVDQVMYPDE